MRRAAFILPHLVSRPDSDSVLRRLPPELARLADSGSVFRLAPMEHDRLPELAWLGLPLGTVAMADGPLIVSGLGADPPAKSVHFRLTLGSIDDDNRVQADLGVVAAEHLAEINRHLARLDSKRLRTVIGAETIHGLVWEDGSLDLGAPELREVHGQDLSASFPQGDGEPLLRRFIDDSVNLLSELEVNRLRREEGLPPILLAWPSGPGFRESAPNLALRRGESAWFGSASLRLRGLCRLVGYRHPIPSELAPMGRFDRAQLRLALSREELTVVVLTGAARLQREEDLERLESWLAEVSARLIAPLIEASAEEPTSIAVILPGGSALSRTGVGDTPERSSPEGLALLWDSRVRSDKALPFDERVLEDLRAPRLACWEAMGQFFAA